MSTERILITVKTYPTLSNKYDEVVCTAGLREDGSWIRVYPVPFRKLDDYENYRKFNWVEVDLVRNSSDPRRESYRPKSEFNIVGHMDTSNNWRERREIVLTKGEVFSDFDNVIERNKYNDELSLATFKPTEIVGLKIEEVERDWDHKKLSAVQQRAKQTDLFQDNTAWFKIVDKLPYKFSYVFKDVTGKKRTMMISDWEIGALYRNEMKRHGGDEQRALQGVEKKYFRQLVEGRDIHFFVGTTQSWDMRNAPNPFLIVGVFGPPETFQTELF